MEKPNLWLVLAGDYGSQVYLTCPVDLVPGLVVRPWDFERDAAVEHPADRKRLIKGARRYQWHEIEVLPPGVIQLLEEVDAYAWPGNEGDGKSISVHARTRDPWSHTVGDRDGGEFIDSDGGEFGDGVWLHNRFHHCDRDWHTRVRELLGLE